MENTELQKRRDSITNFDFAFINFIFIGFITNKMQQIKAVTSCLFPNDTNEFPKEYI